MSKLRFLLIVAVAFVLTYALRMAYQHGVDTGQATVQLQWDADREERAQAANRSLIALQNRSDRLADQLHDQETTLHQEKTHAQAEMDRLRASVRAGSVRLFVPTEGAACPGSPAPEGASPAGGSAKARAELDPATADALVAITSDGDSAIRDLNACIDRYNTVRQSLNTPLDAPAPE